jgi:hypothetical protein
MEILLLLNLKEFSTAMNNYGMVFVLPPVQFF